MVSDISTTRVELSIHLHSKVNTVFVSWSLVCWKFHFQWTRLHHLLPHTTHLTLKMTSAPVVETSVKGSSFQQYPYLDDHTEWATDAYFDNMRVIVFIHIYYYYIVEKVGTSLWCIKKHLYQIKEDQTLKQKPSFYGNLQTEVRYSKNNNTSTVLLTDCSSAPCMMVKLSSHSPASGYICNRLLCSHK